MSKGDQATLERALHKLFTSLGLLQEAVLAIAEAHPDLIPGEADEALERMVARFKDGASDLADYMGYERPENVSRDR